MNLSVIWGELDEDERELILRVIRNHSFDKRHIIKANTIIFVDVKRVRSLLLRYIKLFEDNYNEVSFDKFEALINRCKRIVKLIEEVQ